MTTGIKESPGGMESRTNSTALYTAEKSDIDYFTLAGVCKRTGCSIVELIVWAIRQLIDNGVDFVESNYEDNLHSDDTRIYISTRYDPNTNHLIINVSNPNFGKHEAGFTEERVNAIFEDLNQFVSSKRNLFKLTRGYQGDAMQEELGIPTALASKYSKGREWNEPLIIRNGAGQEFEIRIVIDKINGRNYSKIKTNQTDRADNYTQVEIRVPYDKAIINLDEIKKVLIEYALLNTHISFNFDLVDYINTDNPFEFHEPNRIDLPATQKMFISNTSYKKLTRIYHFDLGIFENLLYSIENKGLNIYDDILQAHIKEGHWLVRSDDLLVPVGQLHKLPEKESRAKIRDIFLRLRNARPNQSMELGPSSDDIKTKRDMLPFHFKERSEALKLRVEQLGYNVKDIKYKIEVGYHYSNPSNRSNISQSTTDTCVPYVIEVAVIHTEDLEQKLLYCEGINASPNHYHSFTYNGYYHNYLTKGGSEKQASEANDLLRQCGYSNDSDCKPEKERSIVLLNLWSPVIEYKEYGKSSINLDPFGYAVYNLLGRMCSSTNKERNSKGEILETKSLLKDFLIERYKTVLLNPTLKETDPWKTSTVVYRKRPDLERRGLYPTRKYLQGLVKPICDEIPEMKLMMNKDGSYHFEYTGVLGVKREALGIYEATRAYIYFRGSTHPVSLKRLEELKTLAAFIVIIEKEGVVELLMHWADLYGVALCYTKGFLTDNAKEFSRLADESGCRIVILTDMDFAGRAMANLVPNIPRIGITLQTLKKLGLELNPDILEELPQPKVKNPKKHQVLTYLHNTHASTAKLMYEQGLIRNEDWKIMSGGKYGKRIEIDNVLAAAGAEKFWKDFILASFKELFETVPYPMTLNIPDYVILPKLQLLNDCVETNCKATNKDKLDEINSEYNDYNLKENGFIEDVTAEEGDITDRIEKHELVNKANIWVEQEIAKMIEEYKRRTGIAIAEKEKQKHETKRYKVDSKSKIERVDLTNEIKATPAPTAPLNDSHSVTSEHDAQNPVSDDHSKGVDK